MINPELKGKVVLITGGNHGIGAATARAFASQEAKVFITYFIPKASYPPTELDEALKNGVGGLPMYRANQGQPGELVVNEIRSKGGVANLFQVDLSEVSKIPMLFDLCEANTGPIDILVINHAHDVFETFDPALVINGNDGISAESIDRHFGVNTRSSALLIEEYLTRYLKRGAGQGCIISLTTSVRHSRNVSYAASKNALVSYCLSAASELGKYGITVNIVCPGATQTGYITPQDEAKLVAVTPLGRLGQSEDIADVIVFLASKQAHWLTGQLIYASGGFNVNR